jgi:hypothetical protein
LSDYPKQPPRRGEIFLVELEAVPGRVPGAVRLRALLKSALRAWGLKCRSVREAPPDAEAPPPDADGAAPPQPGDQHAFVGWRKVRGGSWKAVTHGPTEQAVRELLRKDAPLVCVRPAGVHPDDGPPAHEADGAADAGDR